LDHVFVGLLQYGEVLKGKGSEVVHGHWFTQSSRLQVSNVRRDVQWHELAVQGVDLGPNFRKSVVRSLGIIRAPGRRRRGCLILHLLRKRLEDCTSGIKVFRILGILWLRYELRLILEKRVPTEITEPWMVSDFLSTGSKLILKIGAQAVRGFHAQ
jgi:hypothetical protein